MSSLTGKDLEEFNARKEEIEMLKGFFPEIKDDDEKLLEALRKSDEYKSMPKVEYKDGEALEIKFVPIDPDEIPYEKEEELQEELEKARKEITDGKIKPVEGSTIVGVTGVKDTEEKDLDNINEEKLDEVLNHMEKMGGLNKNV